MTTEKNTNTREGSKFKHYEEESYRALLIAEIEAATGHYHPSYNKLDTEALEAINVALNNN